MTDRAAFINKPTGVVELAARTGLALGLAHFATVARARDTAPAVAPLSLREFMRVAWPIVEPSTPFSDGWHIDAIADHLEAVTRGEIRNLLINMPPRHMKSLCVAVFWPVWSWIHIPHTRWLFSAYAQSLSMRDALKSRRLIESPWFRARYGHVFSLTSDQNMKTRYDNDRTGYRIATSVGGSATGEGGDVIVVDDPHKAAEAASDKKRTSVLEWWDETMSTRLNDQRTGRKVIVMQRVHEDDLSGHVLRRGGYEHLMLPAEYEPARRTYTRIGWADPRSQDGELLWPLRIGPREIATLKGELGSYGYAGQYQQSPMPRGGGMIKREWWRRWAMLPRLKTVIIAADTAHKEGVQNDYTVLACWGEGADGNYYLLDLWRGRVAFGNLTRIAHDFYHGQNRLHVAPLVIEDKGSGTSLLQTLAHPFALDDAGTMAQALMVSPFPREKSEKERELARLPKTARIEAVVPFIEAGKCYLPLNAPWLEEFIAEHEVFPSGQHDDQPDTTAMALIRLAIAPPKARPIAIGSYGYRG